MKKITYVVLVALLAFTSTLSFGQTGELDRFSNATLNDKNEIKIFPNPSVDILQVNIKNSDLENVNLIVYNIIGNTMEVPVQRIARNHFNLKVEDLAPGYYLLAIKDEKGLFKETYRFLKRGGN